MSDTEESAKANDKSNSSNIVNVANDYVARQELN